MILSQMNPSNSGSTTGPYSYGYPAGPYNPNLPATAIAAPQ